MKVAILIWNFMPEPEGGAEKQCRLISKELTKRNISCSIITDEKKFKMA